MKTPSMRYVAYYRVSTQQQANSGLSLEAQKATVLEYIKKNGNELIYEFQETESGKKNDRHVLDVAIRTAIKENATLVIAKLDRLSRDMFFISKLMKDQVRFVCCDMPEATNFTIHVLAAVAEQERQFISERTIKALKAKKLREPDWKPGTDNLSDEIRKKGQETNQRKAQMNIENRHAYHFIRPLREKGLFYHKIAEMLNLENYKTRNGCKFHATQVMIIWKRFASNQDS